MDSKTKENVFKLDVVSIRLVKDAPILSDKRLDSPLSVVSVLGDIMSELDREVICIINLKADNTPINVNFASVGALNEAMAHPRELLKASILSNAASVIMVHCHPSGKLLPSKADTMFTDRMSKVCELVGIPLLDHLIVGGDNNYFFSYKEKGLIKNERQTYLTDYRDIQLDNSKVAERGRSR